MKVSLKNAQVAQEETRTTKPAGFQIIEGLSFEGAELTGGEQKDLAVTGSVCSRDNEGGEWITSPVDFSDTILTKAQGRALLGGKPGDKASPYLAGGGLAVKLNAPDAHEAVDSMAAYLHELIDAYGAGAFKAVFDAIGKKPSSGTVQGAARGAAGESRASKRAASAKRTGQTVKAR